MIRSSLHFILLFLIALCSSGFAQVSPKPAAECMERYMNALKNKSVGVVAHPASLVGQRNLVDTLISRGVAVAAIFSPEHGFRSYEEAGLAIKSGIDPSTGLPVISLYGKKKKPDPADLKNLDIMLFDLQDVGVRFFTYISTLTYVMEACAGSNLPLIVLDRPNPNGFYTDGPVLDEELASFVGLHPVPIVYGMTIGEYARMVNEEGWLKNGLVCDLTVIPVENYRHSDEITLRERPSPNLKEQQALLLYPSLCLFEGTIVSVGRGTEFPFTLYGFPGYPDHDFYFIPQPVKGAAENPMYKGDTCWGRDLRQYYPAHPGEKGKLKLTWLIDSWVNSGLDQRFFNDFFDHLAGTRMLRNQIMTGVPEEEIRKGWEPELERFRNIRIKYLLYPD